MLINLTGAHTTPTAGGQSDRADRPGDQTGDGFEGIFAGLGAQAGAAKGGGARTVAGKDPDKTAETSETVTEGDELLAPGRTVSDGEAPDQDAPEIGLPPGDDLRPATDEAISESEAEAAPSEARSKGKNDRKPATAHISADPDRPGPQSAAGRTSVDAVAVDPAGRPAEKGVTEPQRQGPDSLGSTTPEDAAPAGGQVVRSASESPQAAKDEFPRKAPQVAMSPRASEKAAIDGSGPEKTVETGNAPTARVEGSGKHVTERSLAPGAERLQLVSGADRAMIDQSDFRASGSLPAAADRSPQRVDQPAPMGRTASDATVPGQMPAPKDTMAVDVKTGTPGSARPEPEIRMTDASAASVKPATTPAPTAAVSIAALQFAGRALGTSPGKSTAEAASGQAHVGADAGAARSAARGAYAALGHGPDLRAATPPARGVQPVVQIGVPQGQAAALHSQADGSPAPPPSAQPSTAQVAASVVQIRKPIVQAVAPGGARADPALDRGDPARLSGEIDLPAAQSLSETRGAQASTPAATPARAETPAPVMRQISESLHRLADGGVEIQLRPEELGRVRMQMVQGEHGLTVMVSAERGETLDLMRRHIDQLARALQDMGYSGTQFSFSGGQGQRGGPKSGLASEPSAGASSAAEPAQPARRDTPPAAGRASLDITL